MPIFYPPSQMRHLPLTPPEYYDEFAQYGKVKPQLYGYQPFDEHCHTSFLMNGQYYMPSMAEQQSRYEAEMKRQARAAYQAQMQREHIYGPIAAPVLPPLRVVDQGIHDTSSFRSTAQAPAPKEEKSAGGVAAHLDYDMDTMVDFVSEMATGVFNLYISRAHLPDYQLARSVQPSRRTVDAKFRSYVSGVLTSTRLPKATVLLAMHYLGGRATLLASQNQYHHREGRALYHLLTVGLMLASKFLDDNTFQNRSWAEVSNLPVVELNTREMDWLAGMNWHLHVDYEEAGGVRSWFEVWEGYESRKKSELSLEALKLSPIDTSLRSHRTSRYSPPTNCSPPEAESTAPAISGQSTRRSLTPSSAHQTASNTPEYYPSIRNTVSYLDIHQTHQYQSQSQPFQQPTPIDSQMPTPTLSNDLQGNLVYTRESPVYGPGYVLETRSNGMCTWEVHNFVGIDYTQQYAAQLQIGWCELHRRLNCTNCFCRPSLPPMGHMMQATAA